jgi:hypothetical protein
MLAEPAPPWSVLGRLPKNWWADVVADWKTLDPWRARRPWLDLAVHATVTTGEAAA